MTPASGDDAAPTVADSTTTATEDTAPTEDVDSDLPSEDDLQTYFDAIANSDPSELESAMNLAEQGSVAHAFAGYQLELVNASIDGGGTVGDSTTTAVQAEEGYELCFTDEAGEETCEALNDIEGRKGKIVSFTIDGENIAKRISVGNGKPVRAGGAGSVEMLYAYKRVSNGDLVVIVRLRSNGDPISTGLFEATYRAPTGRQSTAADVVGNTELGADSTSTAAIYFTDAELGGEVTLSVFTNDYVNESEVTLSTR